MRQKRSYRIRVSVTEKERAELEALAEVLACSQSQVIRNALIEYRRKHLEAA